ncbi:2,3,4,5-tetrahydropyridine-2,6-dicarboxylate N-succinyltransferase [Halobacteriales archaeon QS_8_69_73]|nr:MAG: 2,3,4,5-tetrahydropyridine-2,6-dicarboxylate N-succinyltransferase [Halobacteriales archaeon QS_8_69_73]
MSTLRNDIEELQKRNEAGLTADDAGETELAVLEEFLDALEAGEVRAAEKRGGEWEANEWVKQGILLNFGLRSIETHGHGGVDYHDVLPLRDTADLPERGTRNTPDGTVIRRGAHVGSDAILMSPSFVNVGAYVGDGTLVDSCDTVGSAAQIGDDVKLGACRVTSGFVVGEGSVVGENTLLTPNIPVYDLVEEKVVYGELPPERRAFTRYVESSVGDHDLFEGGAYKPAVVATDVEEETLEATRREDALRDN